jgi:hypothetical protein
MCLNCGCGQPNERHGNDANITADDLRRAGEANGQDVATSAANVRSALDTLTRSGSVDRPGTGRDAGLTASKVTSTTRAPR